ncbi:MAG: hypothetical protein Q4G10_01315 [Bacteroidia bacterium]|nr:hypothetical protein [Bacteroidia bacterium]
MSVIPTIFAISWTDSSGLSSMSSFASFILNSFLKVRYLLPVWSYRKEVISSRGIPVLSEKAARLSF